MPAPKPIRMEPAAARVAFETLDEAERGAAGQIPAYSRHAMEEDLLDKSSDEVEWDEPVYVLPNLATIRWRTQVTFLAATNKLFFAGFGPGINLPFSAWKSLTIGIEFCNV